MIQSTTGGIVNIAKRFNPNPAISMSLTGNFFWAKTSVFGGVATGIIKPQLLASTVALRSKSGSICMAVAAPMSTGIIVVAVATLLAISEMATTINTTTVSKSHTGMPCNPAAANPI